jgi:hypothetical protein
MPGALAARVLPGWAQAVFWQRSEKTGEGLLGLYTARGVLGVLGALFSGAASFSGLGAAFLLVLGALIVVVVVVVCVCVDMIQDLGHSRTGFHSISSPPSP